MFAVVSALLQSMDVAKSKSRIGPFNAQTSRAITKMATTFVPGTVQDKILSTLKKEYR